MRAITRQHVLSAAGIGLLIIGFFALSAIRPVQAADNDFSNGITVDAATDGGDNNVGDDICDDGSGNCTLRAAIQESNATAGTQTINFNLSGTPDFTNGGQDGYFIQPQSGLPPLTDTVTINGYSQTGAAVNTAIAPDPLNGVLLIQLDGTNAGGANGLILDSGAAGSIIRGLVIANFDTIGIRVNAGADNVQIKGNYIGTDYTGVNQARNGGQGISTFAASGVTGGPEDGVIGGLQAADRNILSGNDSQSNDANLAIGVQGISLFGGSNNWTIQGNYIGIGADGVTAIPNELAGITIDYIDGLLIGGTQAGAANVFSGNGDGGIQPDYSSNIRIKGNYIGTDYTGTQSVPNGTKGVSFAFDTVDSIVGGSEPDAGNVIAFNTDVGIFTNDSTNDVSIIGNSIHSNGDIGIDNDFDGVTPNDSNDTDTGSNDLLNFPTYDYYVEQSGNTEIDYRLDAPAGNYRIEFFSNVTQDPSGYGEGQEYLGFQNISHPGSGEMEYSALLTGVTGVTNLALTATELDDATISGFGATSEFGNESPPNIDLSIDKRLLNPEDVAPGATLDYELTITNEGRTTADLTSFADVGTGPPILWDFAQPELINAQPYVADGPFAGVSIINVSNPDLLCLWGEETAGTFTGTSDYADYGVVVCWYVGTDTDLEPGGTITAAFTLDVSEDSDLEFDNFALVSALPDDPDFDPISDLLTNDYSGLYVDFVIGAGETFNNISISTFVLSENTNNGNGAESAAQPGGSLAQTGQDIRPAIVLCLTALGGAVLYYGRTRKYKYIAH